MESEEDKEAMYDGQISQMLFKPQVWGEPSSNGYKNTI